MSDSNGSSNRSAMACLLSAATATVTAAAAAAVYIRPHRIHIGESIVGHAVASPRGDILHIGTYSTLVARGSSDAVSATLWQLVAHITMAVEERWLLRTSVTIRYDTIRHEMLF